MAKSLQYLEQQECTIKMSTMSDRVTKMESDIEYIKQAVDEIKTFNLTFEERADKKYASKDTEEQVKTIRNIVLTSVTLALLALVILR